MDWLSRLLLPTFILGFFTVQHVAAQQVPVFKLDRIMSGELITDSMAIFQTDKALQPAEAWKTLEESGQTKFRDFGYSDRRYWAGLRMISPDSLSQWVLEIENPHIDYITLYTRSPENGRWEKVERSGDSLPFKGRKLAHYNPALPIDLSSGQPQLDVLVMLYKQHSSINFNFRIWEQTDFNNHQQIRYALYGGYFGILLLVFIAMTFTYIFLRKTVHLWYLLYILISGGYILADTGLAHQFIYPGSDTFANYARMILTYGFLFTFIPFTQHYFSTSITLAKYHKAFNGLLAITVLHFVVFTTWFFVGEVDGILALTTKSIIILACQLFLLYHGIVQLGIKRMQAIFYLAAFAAMLLSGIYKIISQFGVVPRIVYPLPPLQAGFFIEIVILTVGLGWQIRQIEFDRIKFRSRVNELKNEKLHAYVDGVEEERQRIAMDLHDSVGGNITYLMRVIESNVREQKKQLLKISKKIFTEVRNISHQLAPPGLQYSNLEQNLQQLLHNFNDSSTINYQLQVLDLPDKLPKELRTQIYRLVQETVNNIEKHSNATEANIQLIRHTDQIVLTIEDNGVGLPANYSGKGIGLQHLQMRTKQLGGTFELSSTRNKGVDILIIIPLQGTDKVKKEAFSSTHNSFSNN